MPARSCLALLLCIILMLSMPLSLHASAQNKGAIPSVSAKSAVLIDLKDCNVLFKKNAHARLPMASTTKIMTALVIAEALPLDTLVSVPAEAVGIEGSSVYLQKGELLSVDELLMALLLESANDAAVALAVCTFGSIEAFAKRCNEKALELGLKNSNFTNPHGLFDEAHYTSAYDLAVISAYALKVPRIREIVATKSATIPIGRTESNPFGEGVRHLKNHNKLLSTYEGAIGMKTGYTKKSGRCLVSAAERDGLTLIAVTLNAPDDWRDHTAMLNYGFESFEYRTFFESGAYKYDFPLSNAERSTVTLSNVSPLRALVKKGDLIARIDVEAHFRFAVAPIKKNTVLGELILTVNGKKLRSSLISIEEIASKDEKNGFFESFFN